MKAKIRTIDVNAKEWFDRVNGNSYFAGSVTINFGLPSAVTINMPFQYGYGDQYRYEAFETLVKKGFIKDAEEREVHWRYCERKNIIFRASIQTGCKKRDLMYFNE